MAQRALEQGKVTAAATTKQQHAPVQHDVPGRVEQLRSAGGAAAVVAALDAAPHQCPDRLVPQVNLSQRMPLGVSDVQDVPLSSRRSERRRAASAECKYFRAFGSPPRSVQQQLALLDSSLLSPTHHTHLGTIGKSLRAVESRLLVAAVGQPRRTAPNVLQECPLQVTHNDAVVTTVGDEEAAAAGAEVSGHLACGAAARGRQSR